MMYDYISIPAITKTNLRVLNIKDNEALLLVEKLRSILGSCVKQIYPVGAIRRKKKIISSLDLLLEVPDDHRQCLTDRIEYLLAINFFVSIAVDTRQHKQFMLENSCPCNLYIVSSSYHWGLEYFVLTGPLSFVEKTLNLPTRSWISGDLLEPLTALQVQNKILLTRLENELEMFELLGLVYLEPERRT